MSDFGEEKTEDLKPVSVTMFMRGSDKPSDEYKEKLKRAEVELIDINQAIGWMFPDGSSSIDKVIVDGKKFSGDQIQKVTMKQTGVKQGSKVLVYRTANPEDDDEED